MNQHSRVHWRFGSLVGSAALLLPISTGAESHLQTGAAGTALKATAHVDFKIIIPAVLSLNVSDRSVRVPGAQSVTVISNSRTVTLAATASSSDIARGNVILSAASRRVIAQDALCTLEPAHAARASDPHPVICTASMP